MNNKIITSLSVEDFAAFLDGNLDPESMSQVKLLIQEDPALAELVQANAVVDDSYNNIKEEGIGVPEVLLTDDFAIPSLDLETSDPSSTDRNDSFSDLSQDDSTDADDPNVDPTGEMPSEEGNSTDETVSDADDDIQDYSDTTGYDSGEINVPDDDAQPEDF